MLRIGFFGTFFGGDWNQCEKLFEIKPPLLLRFKEHFETTNKQRNKHISFRKDITPWFFLTAINPSIILASCNNVLFQTYPKPCTYFEALK
jgi:hypothetical protein